MNSSNYLIKASYKRRNRLGRFILWCVIIGVVLLCLYLMSDVYGWTGSSTQKDVEISLGSNLTQVSNLLKDEKIISHPLIFRLVKKFTNDDQIQMGKHKLSSNMSYMEIINEISKISQPEGIKVTIPEGFESYRIADLLEQQGLADKNSFLDKVSKGNYDIPILKGIKRKTDRLEGYLFPATYTFKKDISEDEIIKAFINKFNDEINQEIINRVNEIGMTLDQVITLASIIEREAKNSDEMPIISSIFHNRLKKNSPYPYLQSCATIQYLLKERKPVLSTQDTQIKSPYNTYLHKGLPPGPIANPGINAIKAALYPDDTNYNFFVLNKEGTKHIYSVTYAQHLKAIRENQ